MDFFDFFAVELCETGSGLRITAAFDPADMDLDLQLLTAGGSLVAVAAEAGGTEMIDRDLPPGTYLVKLIKDHGWGGPYTLNVSIPNDYGDVNSDGAVDAADVFTHCTFAEADVNTCGGNGIINLYDILAVLKAIRGHPDCGGCP